MARHVTCLVETMNLGAVVNLLGGLCFCLSLSSPYQAAPLLYGGLHSVLPPHPSWLTTWDVIRTLPGWWAPVVLALLASWVMSGAVFTKRGPLLEWSGLLAVVVLVGVMVGLFVAGLHLLGFGAARFLGAGFWLSLTAMGCAGVGSLVVATSATRLTRAQ